MSTWFVYLIRCNDSSLYTGITTDIERRFQEHRGKDNKGAKYLKGKDPLELVWQRKAKDRSEASKLEYYIRSLTKDKKEQLINNDQTLLQTLTD